MRTESTKAKYILQNGDTAPGVKIKQGAEPQFWSTPTPHFVSAYRDSNVCQGLNFMLCLGTVKLYLLI